MQNEIVARYRHLRAISERHHTGALGLVTQTGMMEHARHLGLAQGRRTLLLGNEEEMILVFDLAIYTARRGRSRAIDRYARSASLAAGSDDALVLEAMRQSRFSLWAIEGWHDVAGVIVTDLLRGGEIWLLDQNLAQSAATGMVFASRMCRPEDYAISCGVIVPASTALMEDLLFRFPGSLGHTDADRFAQDPRFAAAVYRTAVNLGIMDSVEFRAPAMAV